MNKAPFPIWNQSVVPCSVLTVASWPAYRFKRQVRWSGISIFDCVDHNKLWNIQEMGIPDHLTCLLRNLYAGQEATVRTGLGTTDWFQIGKGVLQVCILSPCLCNLYAEYILRNAWLDEAQAGVKIEAGIKITRKSISIFRYADDTTVMAESEEELKILLIQVKEES